MKNQRDKFSIPRGVTYLNCAYMSPLLKSVERAGILGIKRKRNPQTLPPEEFFTESEVLRKEYASFINTPSPGRIVIIPSVSYGIANVVRNVRLGNTDNIIVASAQFPSNYYAWSRLAEETKATLKSVSPPDVTQSRGKLWNQSILEAIDTNTKIVALGNVHWADGTLFDLLQIRKRTQDVGALLIIDGTQSVGALPFDVEKIQPDALICGGYKWLLGPYSIGMAYYGPFFDHGKPVEENWINRLHSEDFTGLVNYQQRYQPGSLRYEVGEHSNFILLPMMIEAIRQLKKWGPANIQEYCRKISKPAITELQKAGCWIEDENFRGQHLFGVRFPKGMPMEKIKEKMKLRKISVSFRGDSMRIAPNVYNDARDFEKLLEVLR